MNGYFNLMTYILSLPYEVKIRKVENGYVCSWLEEISDNFPNISKKEELFEISQNDGDERLAELITFRRMIYFLQEHFGQGRNKHSSNLEIKVVDKDGKDIS